MHSIVNKHSVKLWYVHIMFDMYGSLQGEMAAMLQKYNCDVIMHMRHICFFILQISPWTKFSQKENHSQKRVWGLHTWREYWDANTATPGGGAQEHSGENTGMIFYLLYVLVIGFMLSTLGLAIFIFVNFYPCWIITSIKCWTCNFCHNC